MAVGEARASGGLAAQWNGSSWTVQPTPHGGFEDVSCATPASCTATGLYFHPFARSPALPLVEHWDHARATRVRERCRPGRVSCWSVFHCTAVGVPLAEHEN